MNRKAKNLLIIFFFFVLYNNNIFSDEKDFVSLINAFFDESEGVVVLNWETVGEPKAFYKVYRINEPLEGKVFIPREDYLIKTLDYNVSSAIDIPPVTGKYYYFISVILDGKENTTVLIDQNYTLNPVQFFQISGLAQKLKAKFIPQNQEVLLTWEKPSDGAEITSYQIYRSLQPIDKKNITSTEKIAVLPADKLLYFDHAKTQGQFYYAVTTTSIYNYENLKLLEGQNVMEKPITVASLDAKKLPEFFLVFPVNLNFEYQFMPEWLNLPETLPLLPLEIQLLESEKNPEDQIEEEEEPALDRKAIKKEINDISILFSNYYKTKRWNSFLKEADSTYPKLRSKYAKNKLDFFIAIVYYQLKKYEESGIIIKQLKADKKFIKYNEDKLKFLEKKLKDKK